MCVLLDLSEYLETLLHICDCMHVDEDAVVLASGLSGTMTPHVPLSVAVLLQGGVSPLSGCSSGLSFWLRLGSLDRSLAVVEAALPPARVVVASVSVVIVIVPRCGLQKHVLTSCLLVPCCISTVL